jgi:chromosome segregation ATPase
MSRAEELATQTLDAVGSVRTRLGRAVESAVQLDDQLWEIEKSYRERPELPRDEPARDARPHRSSVLAAAGGYASRLSKLMRDSRDQVAEVRDQLAAAAAALQQAGDFLDELESLPAADSGQPATPADLRQRLADLGSAIATADAGAEHTEQRLGAALRNAAKMQRTFGELDTRRVPVVYEASEALNKGLPGLQSGVGTTSTAHAQAVQASAVADDLAVAVRAASNPTSPSDRQTPAPASEQDHRDRAGGPSRGQQLNR